MSHRRVGSGAGIDSQPLANRDGSVAVAGQCRCRRRCQWQRRDRRQWQRRDRCQWQRRDRCQWQRRCSGVRGHPVGAAAGPPGSALQPNARRPFASLALAEQLDVAFHEDDHPWIESTPRATAVVFVPGRIAYTLLAFWRFVTLRADEQRTRSWRAILHDVSVALLTATEPQLAAPQPAPGTPGWSPLSPRGISLDTTTTTGQPVRTGHPSPCAATARWHRPSRHGLGHLTRSQPPRTVLALENTDRG
jgi:hypothetical protein